MPNEMIERVAKSMYDTSDQKYNIFKDKEFDKLPKGSQAYKYYIKRAKAAIEAIREPTEAMHLAGNNKMDSMDTGDGDAFCDKIWSEMIDAALADG